MRVLNTQTMTCPVLLWVLWSGHGVTGRVLHGILVIRYLHLLLFVLEV